ncbi:unnamed protein product [Arctia plantaginis]|uniref:Uncharacterized protein n=1 Tax=Arctia plantaginis TaxID=874455 RepID=A0A8S1A7F5_ARCPL|nr:unnamed protein product [Arctia plantaginis]CAB3253646.1 unnamed protein product [Arctia plantaginis]
MSGVVQKVVSVHRASNFILVTKQYNKTTRILEKGSCVVCDYLIVIVIHLLFVYILTGCDNASDNFIIQRQEKIRQRFSNNSLTEITWREM